MLIVKRWKASDVFYLVVVEKGTQNFENDPVVFVFVLIFTVGKQESDENDKKGFLCLFFCLVSHFQ